MRSRSAQLGRVLGALTAGLLLTAADHAPLDIQADRLELDQKAGVARFEGNVVARQESLELRCDRLTAHYDDAGAVKELIAEGNPQVRRGDDVLTGERIRLLPQEGRLVVEKARGRLNVPRLAKANAP